MNKIEVKNNSVVLREIDDNIEFNVIDNLITTFRIIFKESTDLEIYFDTLVETKLNIEYKVSKDKIVNIKEIRKGIKSKVQYKYDLNMNSRLYLYRLNRSASMREVDIVNLNGENSNIEFNLRTMSSAQEKYDIYVSHNNRNTTSIVDNIGIALKGGITFNVTGEVEKGNSGSFLDQNNQIVTFDTTKCQINPNLLVDEYDVIANHNATIGSFDNETLFYLMSRGINENDAIKLLSQGLVLNKLKENYDKDAIIEFMNEYWG